MIRNQLALVGIVIVLDFTKNFHILHLCFVSRVGRAGTGRMSILQTGKAQKP